MKKERMKERTEYIVDLSAVIIISFLIIFISMRGWEMDFKTPVSTNGDTMLGLSLAKSIQENGLIGSLFAYRIGAPEISCLIDTPFLDWLMVFETLLLTNICSDFVMANYLIYMLSYPLAAMTMYILQRQYINNRAIRILCSVSFAVVPYHFMRGLSHLTLSNYYILPLGILLATIIVKEEFKGAIPLNYRDSKKRYMIPAIIVLLGLSNIYYTFFSMLIIAVTVMYKMILKKTWKPLFNEFRIFIYTALVFLGGITPKVCYGLVNGGNEVAGCRHPSEVEVYALKIIQMLLPPSYSRVDFLRRISDYYNQTAILINENTCASLGVLAAFGFIGACVWLILHYINKKEEQNLLLNLFSFLILVLILYCTSGGFGTIFNYVVSPQLRALNRVSIVIVALSICVIAILLEKICDKCKISNKRFQYAILTIGLVIVIYLDVPLNTENWQEQAKVTNTVYKDFFAKVEELTEDGSMIYQLPMTEFPEMPPVYNMADYSLLRGYIYSETLRWSYGGMKGRNTKAMELYVDEGQSIAFVDGIIQAGFKGLYIDTDGYADNGMAINQFYQETLGLQPLSSEDGKLYFYSLQYE